MIADWAGLYWHRTVLGLAGRLRHPGAGVRLETHLRAIELQYHVLGGSVSSTVALDGGNRTNSANTHGARDLMAWRDSNQLHLPGTINRYADQANNRDLYFWLAAFFAMDKPFENKLQLPAGIRHLLHGVLTSARTLQQFPGLAPRYQRLCAAELTQRQSALPDLGSGEARVHQLEAAIRFSLGAKIEPHDPWLYDAVVQAQDGFVLPPPPKWLSWPTPFLPVPLWRRPAAETAGLRFHWLKRKQSIGPRGWKKSLSRASFEPWQKVSSPDGDATQGPFLYREWDCNKAQYLSDWCQVTERRLPGLCADLPDDPDTDALARTVQRQFEALRHVKGWNRFLEQGEEVDIEAFVDAQADKRGCGMLRADVYRSRANQWREVSVAVLLDVSRSTDAWVGESRVVEIARRSMFVLAQALHTIGDDFALYGFSSDSRLRVRCDVIKSFNEPYGTSARSRLAALKPENYTRMGAALRHVGSRLKNRPAKQKVLLVLTDGKPTDPTDQYMGEYALEDSRRALLELRAAGISCFGLTIDKQGQGYLQRLFGPGHYALISNPQSLPRALAGLYARITGLAD